MKKLLVFSALLVCLCAALLYAGSSYFAGNDLPAIGTSAAAWAQHEGDVQLLPSSTKN